MTRHEKRERREAFTVGWVARNDQHPVAVFIEWYGMVDKRHTDFASLWMCFELGVDHEEDEAVKV